MLPTIVVGADEATGPELSERWAKTPGPVKLWFYETAEDAVYALVDLRSAHELTEGAEGYPFEQDGDGRWQVNVLWGPNAWALALSAQKPELAHTGWTAVFGAHVDDEPGKPRRVLDKQATGSDPDTRMWQAAPVMRANVMFDVFGQGGDGMSAVQAVVNQFESRDTP